MFRFKKKKPIGGVLKLFKVINLDDLSFYDSNIIKKTINLCLHSFFENSNIRLDDYISLNYKPKSRRDIYAFLNNNTSTIDNFEIVELTMSDLGSNEISYRNVLLNQIKKDNFGIIELVVSCQLDFINKDLVRVFVEKLIDFFPIDYGYLFYFEKNVDISSEKPIKSSFFSNSISITHDEIEKGRKLLDINKGFVPKLYPLNILNRSQLIALDSYRVNIKEIVPIDDQLTIVVLLL